MIFFFLFIGVAMENSDGIFRGAEIADAAGMTVVFTIPEMLNQVEHAA